MAGAAGDGPVGARRPRFRARHRRPAVLRARTPARLIANFRTTRTGMVPTDAELSAVAQIAVEHDAG